jgi:hypothetical protein
MSTCCAPACGKTAIGQIRGPGWWGDLCAQHHAEEEPRIGRRGITFARFTDVAGMEATIWGLLCIATNQRDAAYEAMQARCALIGLRSVDTTLLGPIVTEVGVGGSYAAAQAHDHGEDPHP